MKRHSISNLNSLFKETKGECNFSVISFDAETKKRDMAYGGYDLFGALAGLSTEGAKGRLVILTNKAGWDFVTKFEREHNTRVTFEDMKPYRMKIDEFSLDYRSAAYML